MKNLDIRQPGRVKFGKLKWPAMDKRSVILMSSELD